MKKILYAAILIALLGNTCLLPARAAEHEAAAKPEKKGEGEGKAAAPKDGPIYVNLQPMVLPVLDEKGPQQLITLLISLEVENEEKQDLIKERMPRLNDAYLQTLYGALDTRTVNKGSLVDITRIKQKLKAPTERVLGKDVAKDVLIQAVAQRHL